ncbi:DUF4124 domain-containing protein [Schlegelella sp. S2-27]|uniref:DUF4124 domain-containing protein n=1 Tax=Caldimonas mangrovi TaxID=2944811 RepID=A0ABT0YQW9_9BURK|nr:DUF4124 domain-containing protein [Caldimonas mangrovi]MCM5681126.1 DUF4124 domain-containing protein [Caldimonas mangrovi]
MKTASLRLLTVAVGLFLGLTASLPAAAQWKWKDAAGKVQYSDRPPPATVPEKDILQRPSGSRMVVTTPAAPTSGEAAEAPLVKASAPTVDKELEARRKKEEQEQEAKRRAEEERIAKQRAENCARAKSYQQTLDSGVRIARTNDKGEREILDDAARAQETARNRQVMAADCK